MLAALILERGQVLPVERTSKGFGSRLRRFAQPADGAFEGRGMRAFRLRRRPEQAGCPGLSVPISLLRELQILGLRVGLDAESGLQACQGRLSIMRACDRPANFLESSYYTFRTGFDVGWYPSSVHASRSRARNPKCIGRRPAQPECSFWLSLLFPMSLLEHRGGVAVTDRA